MDDIVGLHVNPSSQLRAEWIFAFFGAFPMPCQTDRSTLMAAVIIAAILGGHVGCQRDSTSASRSTSTRNSVELAAAGEPAVELVIDFGDGAQKRFSRIPHQDGMTALAALRFAASHPHGVTFESTGSGSAALVTRIDDLANEAGADGKNWLYRVGGKLADKSCDAYVLSPGDLILWKFEKFE